jgi:crotonobetainyl-CoA:carnitine CoA-transferase CaiB-like acyl-CoA transferase
MTSAAGSVVRVPGDPLKLGPPAPSYPAHLGQDTDSVLSSLLGIAPEQLRVLKNQGAISQYEPGAARGAGR